MSQETPDLPEIPDLPDIPEFPELAEIPEMPMEPVEAGAAAAAAAASRGPRPGGGESGAPMRELEEAPKKLRQAAKIAAIGAALPFMGAFPGRWSGEEALYPLKDWFLLFLAAKVLIVIGAWLWFQQVKHNWGPKLSGFLGTLAEVALGKKPKADEGAKKRKSIRDQGPTSLKHPFPSALHILSLGFAISGVFVLPFMYEFGDTLKLVAELGMFTWALYTLVHIASYERWGSFNPIFPLMFLAMAASGLLRVFAGFANMKEHSGLVSLLGGAIVFTGGLLAAYTMFLSLREAKREGDRKKAAALEARRAARSARR